MFFISNFFQIFGYNKNKSNQIKSNFLDHDLYFKFFSNFWVFALTYQIKSNQILLLLFDRSNWNKLIWFDLIWTIFRPFQIICPGLYIGLRCRLHGNHNSNHQGNYHCNHQGNYHCKHQGNYHCNHGIVYMD